ncbi:S8/S53 family peptidase [Roseibium sp. M-1]
MIRVGLIDGALPQTWPGLRAQARFCEADGVSLAQNHAEAMAQTVAYHAGDVDFLNAVIFPGQLSTRVESVCAALDWLANDPPEIVLCAFGMARSSIDLAVAVARLQRAGCLVVASAPARGGQAYPAAFDGVLSVQGDARCARGELSRLDLRQATYGACPDAAGAQGIRGASAAAAHFAGMLAKSMKPEGAAPMAGLEPFIRFHGRERRDRQQTSSPAERV